MMHVQLPSINKATLVFLLALSSSTAVDAKAKPKNAILLSEVETLTFRKDGFSTHRRVAAVPQLTCVGGSGQGLFEPDVVRCRNAGASYGKEDVEWTCTASLPPEFKLGSTEVICEGYESPEDPYILKGSCGLEYRLVLTSKGEEKFGQRKQQQRTTSSDQSTSSGIPSALFWILFVGVLGWIIWSGYVNQRNRGHRPGTSRPRRTDHNGGSGYDDGDDDPPPPYSQFPGSSRQKSSRTSYASGGSSSSAGWQPGFGTGAALGSMAGAAAGYAAGSRGGSTRSSWFGGGGGSRRSGSSSGGGESSAGPSSERYTSTGFGGTSRR